MAMDMSKYGCVLQPLKQLEEVWGIDLASTLQMYAAEVAEVTVECGGQALNFAQAALLIMGASSIYSKKVDALQGLVQETYDLIINRQKTDKDGEKKAKRKRTRVVLRQLVQFAPAAHVFTVVETFRSDVADVLRMTVTGGDAFGGMNGGALGNDVARIAEGELIPLENTNTGGFNYRSCVAQTSNEGLLLPNVRQDLIGNLTYENDLVTPARQGVRMPPTPGSTIRSGNILPEQQRKEEVGDEEELKRLCAEELRKALAEQLDSPSSDEESDAGERKDKVKKGDDAKSARGGDDEKSDNDDDDDDAPPEDEYDQVMNECRLARFDQMNEKAPDRHCEPVGHVAKGRQARALEEVLAPAAQAAAQRYAADALGCLLPVDGAGKLKQTTPLDGVPRKEAALALMRKEVEYEKMVQRAQQQAAQQQAEEQPAEPREEAHAGRAASALPGHADAAAPDPETTMQSAAPPGLAQVESFGAMDPEGMYPSPIGSEGGACDLPPLTPCSGRGSIEPPLLPGSPGAAGAGLAHTYFNADITRMNDLLHASHVLSNEQQAKITHDEAALQQRVAAWQDHLEPLLTQQTARPPYDIHNYARRLLDAFAEEAEEPIDFQDLLHACCDGDFEISRFFLALLQLSNTKNVRLDVEKKDDVRVSDRIAVTLLTKTSVFNFDEEDVAMQMAAEPPKKRRKG